MDGILEADLSVYQNTGSSTWGELTTNRDTGNNGGDYSYAEGDNEPTAVPLQALAVSPGASLALVVVSLRVIPLLAASGLALRRRYMA